MSEPQQSLRRTHGAERAAPSLSELARTFLVIGALAFGGQGGLLALLSRAVVERRGWVEEAEITEAFTYVQLLPGAVVVQVGAYLGYRMRGWRGAFVVTASFLLPSLVVMLSLAAAYRSVAALAGVPAALRGLTAAVVGLIGLAAYKQARKSVRDALGISIAVVVCTASIWQHVNPAVLVVTAGLIGIMRESVSKGVSSKEGVSKRDTTRKQDAAIQGTMERTMKEPIEDINADRREDISEEASGGTEAAGQ